MCHANEKFGNLWFKVWVQVFLRLYFIVIFASYVKCTYKGNKLITYHKILNIKHEYMCKNKKNKIDNFFISYKNLNLQPRIQASSNYELKVN